MPRSCWPRTSLPGSIERRTGCQPVPESVTFWTGWQPVLRSEWGDLMIFRREMLGRVGTGLGLVGLAGLMSEGLLATEAAPSASPLAPRAPHFAPRAKRIIHLY